MLKPGDCCTTEDHVAMEGMIGLIINAKQQLIVDESTVCVAIQGQLNELRLTACVRLPLRLINGLVCHCVE
ncbi:MAG: hypothetical protein ACR5K7_01585 [Symbiopectobacterium sp.]